MPFASVGENEYDAFPDVNFNAFTDPAQRTFMMQLVNYMRKTTVAPDPATQGDAIDLNTTHRSSSGTDHSDVVLNTTHRGSAGSDHSDVVLNTTHRSSNGNDHSNVVLNNTHRTGNGADHADVATNTTHRSSDGKNHSDVVLNNTHRSSDGSDHTFINQDMRTTASPEFVDVDATGHYEVDGTQVVSNRVTNYTAMTGFADRNTSFDTSSVNLQNLARRVKALQDDLTTHGIIGA